MFTITRMLSADSHESRMDASFYAARRLGLTSARTASASSASRDGPSRTIWLRLISMTPDPPRPRSAGSRSRYGKPCRPYSLGPRYEPPTRFE